MPKKQNILTSPWLPRLLFVVGLLPLAWLAWRWWHNDLGINRIEFVARYTGRWTLRILLASLGITPLRRIPGLFPLLRLRRMLGLFAFFYGSLHALHYFGIDVQWNLRTITEDLTFRRFFIAGGIALGLMIPLAATSFNRAVRWMGGARWQLLHRLVYISAIAAVVHYWWQGKVGTQTPQIYAAILALLLAIRFVFWLTRKFRPAAPARGR